MKKKNGLIVDAVFGIGLSKPVQNDIADFFTAVNESGLPCVALDIPSGVRADTGEIAGTALRCEMTVTFCRPKIGHFLYPGKEYTGELAVCPIGIPDSIVAHSSPLVFENIPALFDIPSASPYDHKYTRGAVLIRAGKMTGAARLAAAACRRAGAGIALLSCTRQTYPVFAAADAGTVVQIADNAEDFASRLSESKIAAAVIGMGATRDDNTKACLHAIADSGKPFVADAGALSFIKSVKDRSRAVITPHTGEFDKLFPDKP